MNYGMIYCGCNDDDVDDDYDNDMKCVYLYKYD